MNVNFYRKGYLQYVSTLIRVGVYTLTLRSRFQLHIWKSPITPANGALSPHALLAVLHVILENRLHQAMHL
jgi:hypothetical protein